ncbi:hypothetical protein PV326_004667 [Microctonus aethiopoides]|nr:hypothetical protein PV326_004667 [Microctonus aethiopoides]
MSPSVNDIEKTLMRERIKVLECEVVKIKENDVQKHMEALEITIKKIKKENEEEKEKVYANGREDRNDEEKKEVSRLKHMNWGRSYEKRDKHPKVVWNFNERNGQLEEVTFRGEAERNRRRQEATATTAGRWKYD